MSESGWRRYRSIWRPRVQQDVDDEMDFHLRMRIDEFMAAGMSKDEAERTARARYGDVMQVRSDLVGIDRRQRRKTGLSERIRDARHDITIAARSLRREPRFAIGVILTLGLGIAANATMFNVVDQLLLRGPSGVADANTVRRMYLSWIGPENETETTGTSGYVVYTTLRDHAAGIVSVGAYNDPYPTAFGSGANLRLVPTAPASWDLFPTLGVRPELGRFFSREEDTPGQTANVAVISDGLWREEFASDPKVLGSAIDVGEVRYTVVGVAPPGFNGPDRLPTDVWLPMTSEHGCDHWQTTLDCQWLKIVARVQPGVTQDQLDDAATRAVRVPYAAGGPRMRQIRGLARPLWYGPDGKPSRVARVAQWLMGVAVIVLMITCANVTNLLLARARRRRREIAVRLALGAGTSRLITLVLTETFVLAATGATVALGLAFIGGRLMRQTLLAGVAMQGPVVDLQVFGFTFALAMVVALAVGGASAAASLRVNANVGLRETSSAGGGQRQRVRAALSGLQAALSVVLLVGAGLFMLSLHRSQHVALGFDAAHVLQARLQFSKSTALAGPGATPTQEKKARARLFVRTAEQLAAQPWVEAASVAVGSPLGFTFAVDLEVPGRDTIPQLKDGGPYISAVSSGYFATVGTRLVRGRLFTATERDGTPPVTIVNETMARILWPGEDPLTKCLIIGDRKTSPCAPVVGVVADVHLSGISDSPTMQYYVPLGQERGIGGSVLLIRPRGDAEREIERARKTVSRFSGVQDVRVEWLESELDPQFEPYRLGATMFTIFGSLALIIAAVGLYSVVAYLVADRTREIGVRIALGAGAHRIIRQVLASGMASTGAGILVGLIAAGLASPFVEPLLFQVRVPNEAVFAGAALLVLLIALVATWAPARRASRVDPVIALRTD